MLCRCTINTAQGYRVLNTQNSDKSNIKVQQEGREFNFEICGDGGYRSRMAQSYDNMVGHVMSCHDNKGLNVVQAYFLGTIS